MIKRVFGISLFAIGMVLAAGLKNASANEGTAMLSTDKSSARCFAASVLVDQGDYRMLLTCENLVLPPASETLFYRVWATRASVSDVTSGSKLFGRSQYIALGNLANGKLSARTREAFTDVFVTAEKTADTSAPVLTSIVVKGSIQPIDFGASRTQVVAQPTESIAHVSIAPTAKPTAGATVGRSVVGTAFRVFLTIVGIIIAVAVVISLIQRQSASK